MCVFYDLHKQGLTTNFGNWQATWVLWVLGTLVYQAVLAVSLNPSFRQKSQCESVLAFTIPILSFPCELCQTILSQWKGTGEILELHELQHCSSLHSLGEILVMNHNSWSYENMITSFYIFVHYTWYKVRGSSILILHAQIPTKMFCNSIHQITYSQHHNKNFDTY